MDPNLPLDLRLHQARALTRRTLLRQGGLGLGAIALGGLLAQESSAQKPTRPAKAKSVIYLHMSGAPPTLDLFDYKPKLNELDRKPCPESLLKGERFAFIKGVPTILGSPHPFKQGGGSGLWVS